ncbi:calcium/calmodulin-dependent protein kinase, putative [Plasmodium knowlesi strain H]|uniref:Calcium/calmodulin-dependent protein kinase, putative n=3 Tax=Plasmodium knowlesi TaxID=5850 RepID=A0A5K1U7V0_PLAKH|nr:calcium/calmodulin-dependent protein kinase, putative [Plasmodium knowlesi strain H]OTN65023.1 putative Calcium/calmodulin-dependent protein kinase [Plasmodium knowlesi]CAA9988075.1 calcium/calmodulin-dependent protein kinase, putative [Plasmodium knowlesi strain H]SBO19934.1 calcium/calmodulin-dependent protein kinase, putative [Plasmodium knowlesi strain H]SBO29079.1 calcium/calmodulin-dependent protein kinase, putative [Plasmodium knowlesi strain H]VVS77549.1 calcium/calmodulin-dependent|eukprot:XP_002259049.1 protein kinase, putative [Plasmodium knowlesi strain H]
MESNGAVHKIQEKRKKRKILDLEEPNFGSANVSAYSNARVCTNRNCASADEPRHRKKIIKLKNRKIEDLFVIKNFLPICEEFLIKHHENIFSNLLSKQDEEKRKKTENGDSLQAIKEGEVGQDESEVGMKVIQIEQNSDRRGGEIKEEERTRRKVKRKKRSKSLDNMERGCESVDHLEDSPTVNSEEGSTPNDHQSNLYKMFVQHTKQCLREMDLPFDRAVLLNIVDKKDNTHKIMKIVNKKKVITAFGETWECMIEHIMSLREHKNLMKIYDIYDDEKNFYMIMEKLHGKELFNFLVYKKQVKESVCKYIISQIFQAINYLHHHNIIHRDIKPENLMFRNKKRKDKTYQYNYELVLIDFDTCQFLYPLDSDHLAPLYCSPGTTNITNSVSPSSCANGMESDCPKLCKHREVKKMEQKKGNFPEEIRKKLSKPFSERSTSGRNTQHQRSGTSNLCHHSGRQETGTKSSLRKKHMKLVGTYGYIAPEIIKGYNYSILSDMWSIGIIFYILMTGITPLPMCLMVNYKNTKDIILKKEKKGINFSLLSFNRYPLARDLCEKLLQFDPADRMPNSVIASHHPWLRYFNMLARNITLCPSGKEYLSPSHLNQNLLHSATYVNSKRPRYEDRNSHVILPYHIHQQMYQKEDLHPFLSLSSEQKYYYLINQGVKNYYALGNDIFPHSGLSTSIERLPYLRGGNLSGDTLPVCDEKIIATVYPAQNNFEEKKYPMNYYHHRDSKHSPSISHQFSGGYNGADAGSLHAGEEMTSVLHTEKMTSREGDEMKDELKDELNDVDEDDHMEDNEKTNSAQRRRSFRKKTGKFFTNLKGKIIDGAIPPESENAQYASPHRYILTQRALRNRDDKHPLTGSLDSISVHPDEELTPECNNFVDLFEHLVEKKKRKFTMAGKTLDQLPAVENSFPMYYIRNDEPVDRTKDEINRLFKRKEHTTTMKEKNVEYIRTKNLSEIFASPSMCIIPQNDPMKTIQIDHDYKGAYGFSPHRHVHLSNNHFSVSHKGGGPNVILLPQPLPPSIIPLVYHHSNELRNSIVLNDKGHLTNDSEDIVHMISTDRHSNMCYANEALNAYDPCQVTNLYETPNSLNESQIQQLTLQEEHIDGMQNQQDADNGNLSRITTRSMLAQNLNIPPIYVDLRRTYKNNIEMVSPIFREN